MGAHHSMQKSKSDLQLQTLQFLSDPVQLICFQIAQLVHQFYDRNGVDLLQMKGSFFEEWFRTAMFPTIAPERICVSEDRYHCQLIITRVASQQKARAHLRSQPKVHHPDLTGVSLRHL